MKAIVAMDLNRVIGCRGILPWYLPEDFKWFKKMTSDPITGGQLIVGNTTFQSMGLLPNRFTYVLTSSPTKQQFESREKCRFIDLKEFHRDQLDSDRLWLIGGAKAYQALIKYCSEVFVTIVLDEYNGDTFMPKFEHLFSKSEILNETKKFWVVRYWND